jgi:hypothetical protein
MMTYLGSTKYLSICFFGTGCIDENKFGCFITNVRDENNIECKTKKFKSNDGLYQFKCQNQHSLHNNIPYTILLHDAHAIERQKIDFLNFVLCDMNKWFQWIYIND